MKDRTSQKQLEKFKATAREIGADESEVAFDEKLKRLMRKPEDKKSNGKGNN